MKNWNSPEIVELNVNDTEHQWEFSWEWDGGYLGDGKISGWFGPDPKPVKPNPTHDPSGNCGKPKR